MARHRIPLAIAVAVFAVAGLAATAAANDGPARPTLVGRAIVPTEAALPGTDCRVIDFESAEVLTLSTMPPRHVLVVRGEKPYLTMQVDLIPLVYIRQPEYWGINVVGCLHEGGLPAVAAYVAKLDLDGTIGTRGIDVIGTNRSERIGISGEPAY